MKINLDERFTEVTSEEMMQVEGGGFLKNLKKRLTWKALVCPVSLIKEIYQASVDTALEKHPPIM